MVRTAAQHSTCCARLPGDCAPIDVQCMLQRPLNVTNLLIREPLCRLSVVMTTLQVCSVTLTVGISAAMAGC